MTSRMHIACIYSGTVRFYSDETAAVTLSKDGEVLHRRASDEQVAQCIKLLDDVKWPPDDIDIDNVYVRFGDLPTNGISTNHATGEHELGTSVYEAAWDATHGTWHINLRSALCGAMIAGTLSEAPVYLVTGTEVGYGSDGEPVIANPEVICDLAATNESPLCCDFTEVRSKESEATQDSLSLVLEAQDVREASSALTVDEEVCSRAAAQNEL